MTEREYQHELAATRESNAQLVARLVVLEARVERQYNQVKWLRISRDNWKFRHSDRMKEIRRLRSQVKRLDRPWVPA